MPLLMVTKSDKFQTSQYICALMVASDELTLPAVYCTERSAGTIREPTVITIRKVLKEKE
jgi:hypothetical protein